MSKTIAVAGKGGTGKTTMAAILAQTLSNKGVILAIDADPSSNLNMALGLPLEDTVGNIREEMLEAVQKRTISPSVAKVDYLDLKVRQAMVESERIDLLAMGRPEGPGCYCAANEMLRLIIDRIAKQYDYVIMDCEAGMEHISRQTTRDLDVLLIATDPTVRGVVAAGRMRELIGEMRTHVGRTGLVINRMLNGLSPELQQAVDDSGLEVLAMIPADPGVTDLDATGHPLTELPADSPVRRAVESLVQELEL